MLESCHDAWLLSVDHWLSDGDDLVGIDIGWAVDARRARRGDGDGGFADGVEETWERGVWARGEWAGERVGAGVGIEGLLAHCVGWYEASVDEGTEELGKEVESRELARAEQSVIICGSVGQGPGHESF